MIDLVQFMKEPAFAEVQSDDRYRLVAEYLRRQTPRDERSNLRQRSTLPDLQRRGFTRAMEDTWMRWPWDGVTLTLALVAWTRRGDAIVKLWPKSRWIEWHLLTRDGITERLKRDTWPLRAAFLVRDEEGGR